MGITSQSPHQSQMSALLLQLAADATVRGTTTPEGLQIFSVYDFINLVCHKTGSYSRQVWMRLINSNFKNELEFYFIPTKNHLYQNGTNGKRSTNRTPAMTLRGLQRLLLILDNKVASNFRHIVEGTFTRFMSGDTSMIQEIHSNAASSAPIHQAYRQALAQEPTPNTTTTERMLQREEALFTIELHERYMALHERGWALYEKSLALYKRT